MPDRRLNDYRKRHKTLSRGGWIIQPLIIVMVMIVTRICIDLFGKTPPRIDILPILYILAITPLVLLMYWGVMKFYEKQIKKLEQKNK